MPVDTSIYSSIKMERPDILGSMQKGANLRQLATQNEQAEQEMAAAEKKRKLMAAIPAMEHLAAMTPEQRATEYPKLQEQMIASGVMPKEQALPEHDEKSFQFKWAMMQRSPEYRAIQTEMLKNQHTQSEIAKNYADANRPRSSFDPLQLFIAKEKYQEVADAKKKEQDLQTPYGIANNAGDAEKLKSAGELKANFDRKLQEMISLREEFGGEALNRDAVGRGKQLANDLLLLYKDLAKLGVMSQSDENILRSIIPSDPLEFRSPVAALQGQDPTMHRMKKFKADAEADFQTRLANRLRGGGTMYAGKPPATDGKQDVGSSGFGTPSAVAAEPPKAPKPGHEEDDYVFMGGDPADQKNWKRKR